MTTHPFNPLDKENLGKSIAEAMLEMEPLSMPPKPFDGVGIYAIYYVGNFPLYKSIKEKNKENFSAPIYVGKAVPSGSRKGGGETNNRPTRALYKRIMEHVASIEQAKSTLELKDFKIRYMTVDDIWIPLGESLLIKMFKPLWNHKIDGFGNHTPGSGREKGKKSAWDMIHPGRPWAEKLPPHSKTEAEWKKEIKDFLAKSESPKTDIVIPKK